MKEINQFDKETIKNQVRNAEPFPHFYIDNFLKEDFANEVYNAFPSYEEAKKVGKSYYKVNEKEKVQITDSAIFPEPIKRLHELLASKEFLELISDIMGIPDLLADPDLIGGGIHETNSGGHLDVHVDFNYLKNKQWHRRLNILIYFNKDWKEEYGGYFDIWDKDVKQCYGAFAPLFNRVFVFATSEISYHGVRPITCPPGVSRKSFAAYYYTEKAPDHWSGQHHSTIFKPRPDEWLKGNILMPYEESKKTLEGTFNKIKKAVKSFIN